MRKLTALVLSVVLCLLLACGVQAAGDEVSRLSADVKVAEDGSSKITLNIDAHFLASPRDFVVPLASGAKDILASGASYDLTEEKGVDCVAFHNAAGFSGDLVFVCSYSLDHTVAKDKEGGQVFTLKLPEKGWNYPIEKYELTVTFPAKVETQPGWYSAYHGVDIENNLNTVIEDLTLPSGEIPASSAVPSGEESEASSADSSGEKPAEHSPASPVTGSVLTVTNFERFKNEETLTMTLKFKEDTFHLRHAPGQTASFDIIFFWIVFAAALLYWIFTLRGKSTRPVLRQTPVNEASAGEIPCELFGLEPDLGGTLAHWGNLGYLNIVRSPNGKVFLQKKMEMGNERSTPERKLFYSIFRSSSTMDASNPRLSAVAKRLAPRVRRSWNHRLYSRKSGNPGIFRFLSLLAGLMVSLMTFDLLLPPSGARWFLMTLLTLLGTGLCFLIQSAAKRFYRRRRAVFLTAGAAAVLVLFILSIKAGSVALMLLNLLLQIFTGVSLMFGGRRNSSGEELVRQLLGLRKFLAHADTDSLLRLTREDSLYFYEMLPFAEGLGVGSAFAKCCRELNLEPCPWLSDTLSDPITSQDFYTCYSQIMAAVRREPSLSPAPRAASREAGYDR